MEITFSNRMKDIKGSAIREIFKLAGDPNVISLAGGNPAPELFPAKELAEIASKLLTEQPVLSLQYGVTEGYLPLRQAVMERMQQTEQIGRDFDDIVITSGGQQGIELATKCLVNEGDIVIAEEPSFIGELNAFRSYGAKLIGIPMDADGMNLERLEDVLKTHDNVKLIYTIPTFQNPSAITMSLEKRRALYELAKRYHVFIIEDNPYGELTFDGNKVPTIKSMDTEGWVLYSGSFSKILSPGMRIGFLIGLKDVIAKIVVAKQVSDVHTPMLTQLMTYEYLRNYDIDALIKQMRACYAHRCGVMLDAIKEYFPASVSHTTPGGGLFIWCDMGGDYDTQQVAKMTVKKNVVFVPGATFMVDMDKPCSAFRLNYSTMNDEHIRTGIRYLGEALKEIIANNA